MLCFIFILIEVIISKKIIFDINSDESKVFSYSVYQDYEFSLKLNCIHSIDILITKSWLFESSVYDIDVNENEYNLALGPQDTDTHLSCILMNTNSTFGENICSLEYSKNLAWYYDIVITFSIIFDIVFIIGLIIVISILSVCLCKEKKRKVINIDKILLDK